MVNATSEATFQTDVLDSDVPVLVDFWAPWCGPCRMVSPVVEKIAENVRERARVFTCNVDENMGIAGTYGIQAIPTVMVFKNGAMQEQLVGVQPRKVYEQALGA